MTIRVAVADDQAIIRSGLRVQISLAPDLEFVGEASNGEQAVAVARQQRPDVLLMDVRMPVLDGIDATRRIAGEEATQAVRVIVLTTFDLDDYVYRALRAGASGFLLKDTSPEQLLALPPIRRPRGTPRRDAARPARGCAVHGGDPWHL